MDRICGCTTGTPHRWAVGVRDPLKSSITGPSLLVNCYHENKSHKNFRLPPPPLNLLDDGKFLLSYFHCYEVATISILLARHEKTNTNLELTPRIPGMYYTEHQNYVELYKAV